MKRLNNKSGFTLIEIIVVLIIIGILAAIALPNLFSNVSKTRSEEALATISSARSIVEGCIQGYLNTDNVKCSSTALPAPGNTTSFTYTYAGPAAANGYDYKFQASGIANGIGATDVITVSRAVAANSPVVCQSGGVLAGAC